MIEYSKFNPTPSKINHRYTMYRSGFMYVVTRYVDIGEYSMQVDFPYRVFATRRGFNKFIQKWLAKNE